MASGSSLPAGLQNTLLPTTPETFETLQRFSALTPGASVSVSLNSSFDYADNTLRGWFCKLPPDAPATRVPLQPNMFDGITVVETGLSETRILELLRDRRDTLRRLSMAAEKRLSSRTRDRVSWLRCRPQRELPLQKSDTWHYVLRAENLARYTKIGVQENLVNILPDAPLELVPDETTPNYMDSTDWQPELAVGGFIGLYHQWYPLVNGDRELKLFFVCQSHCQLAGMEIKQIVNDIPHDTSVYDLACSEEIWWLQAANMRNRCRLISDVAAEMGIPVPLVEDAHSASERMMAHATAHTFTHGFYIYRDGCVGVANECIPTQFVSNGVVCRFSPWEGVGIFKGPHVHNGCRFGTAFGGEMDVFPTTTVRLAGRDEMVARRQRLVVQHSSCSECSFWNDSDVRRHVRLQLAPTVGENTSSTEDEDDADGSLAHGFHGTDDPELDDVALWAWRRARRRALSQQTVSEGGGDAGARSAAYVSFNDHVVFNKLEAVGWDQRYGMLQLLPLCLYSHKMA